MREGDEIVAVDGQPVDRDSGPAARLVNAAGKDVRLSIRSGGATRTVAVRTMRDEQPLRYRDWVEANRARVHAASNGKLGYVHVPNMGPLGYSEFHRYYQVEVEHEGLVVDVRWNGGGHVSQLLLEKLSRRRVAYSFTRWMGASPYPDASPMGPLVALTNEYAGSDGDIFSHNFKQYRLGPLIGKRTWGGVVGIWPRHALVDGAVTTQPEFSYWFQDGGFGVEGYGTDPDIEVEIRPEDHAKGLDPQLERGIAEAMKLVATLNPRVPEPGPRPNRRPPALPKA
jgi:tricorn protease